MCPRYDHRCPACEKVFEVDKPLKDAGKEVGCPDCETPSPQVVSAPAIHWRNRRDNSAKNFNDWSAEP